MLVEILLQRLVTFLVDGQRESVSVLLIRYGMSEHYTIGYYDIALADKLINTASYRMRFFTDQMEINTRQFDEKCNFLSLRYHLLGRSFVLLIFYLFFLRLYDSHANTAKKKMKWKNERKKYYVLFSLFLAFLFFFFLLHVYHVL